jgi:hypothetical protein
MTRVSPPHLVNHHPSCVYSSDALHQAFAEPSSSRARVLSASLQAEHVEQHPFSSGSGTSHQAFAESSSSRAEVLSISLQAEQVEQRPLHAPPIMTPMMSSQGDDVKSRNDRAEKTEPTRQSRENSRAAEERMRSPDLEFRDFLLSTVKQYSVESEESLDGSSIKGKPNTLTLTPSASP